MKNKEAILEAVEGTIFFHGTNANISKFSLDYVGAGTDQYGSGIYFTSSAATASSYAGEDGGNVIPVFLTMKNPLVVISESSESRGYNILEAGGPIRHNKIRRLIMASPNKDALWDFGDIQSEGYLSVLEKAAKAYTCYDDILTQVNTISNDFFAGEEKALLSMLYEICGYDGVIIKHDNDELFAVSWDPAQISSLYDQQNTARRERLLSLEAENENIFPTNENVEADEPSKLKIGF